MSNGIRHLFKRRVRKNKPDTARLAARLAPLEEQGQRTTTAIEERHAAGVDQPGTIVVDKNSLQVPKEMIEGGEKHFLGMEPVTLVILAFMLCFIAWVAWQISQMPLE